MYWIYYGFLSAALIGVYNVFLENTKTSLPVDIVSKHLYLCLCLVITGLIALVFILYYHASDKKRADTVFQQISFPSVKVVVPGILLFIYMLSNLMALSRGGGIAIAVINLNMVVSIALGVLLFRNKINRSIVLGLLVILLSTFLVVREYERINI